jgi:hypothetical protein
MTTTAAKRFGEVCAAPTTQATPARLFYLVAALILLIVTFAGFSEFYLHGRAAGGRQISSRIVALVVTHGALMTAWIVLFSLQPLLILSRHRGWHMMLGRFGAVLAAAVFMVGLAVAIESVRVGPEGQLWALTRKQFMAVSCSAMAKFLVFVAAGVLTRRRPEIHRSMMLLATLSVVGAATDRIAVLHFYQGGTWEYLLGPMLPILILGALFLIVRWSLTRRFDKWYGLGYAGLVLTAPLIMVLARSQTWDRFATVLLR